MPRSSFPYAQLPLYQYQTFDKNNLTYSEYPIIPRTPRRLRYFGEGADADEPTKNDNYLPDQPLDIEMSEPDIEIIDAPAEPAADTVTDAAPESNVVLSSPSSLY
jgi:hypothetical protein